MRPGSAATAGASTGRPSHHQVNATATRVATKRPAARSMVDLLDLWRPRNAGRLDLAESRAACQGPLRETRKKRSRERARDPLSKARIAAGQTNRVRPLTK